MEGQTDKQRKYDRQIRCGWKRSCVFVFTFTFFLLVLGGVFVVVCVVVTMDEADTATMLMVCGW